MVASPSTKLTADMLADLEVPHEIQLSPSSKYVVYTLRSDWNRLRGRWVSSLWIAEVGKRYSARQLTNGESNDSWPQFSPGGNSIAFLSDRASEGVTALWIMNLSGGDAAPLTPIDCEKGVSKFAWSGDGRYIAYLSADETTAEKKAKDERGDDAMVYGERWEYSRLRTVEVATKIVATRVSLNCHVYDFAWSPDSKNVAYATQITPEGNSAFVHDTSIETVGLGEGLVANLGNFPSSLEDFCWVAQDLWWRATRDLTSLLSSKSIYKMSLTAKTWARYAFGDKDCASTCAMPPGLRKISGNSFAVQVQSGLSDQLWSFPEGVLLYNELHEVKAWDVAFKGDKIFLTVVKSSADVPSEVYSFLMARLSASPITATYSLGWKLQPPHHSTPKHKMGRISMAFLSSPRVIRYPSLGRPLPSFTVDHINACRMVLICRSSTGLRGLHPKDTQFCASTTEVAVLMATYTLVVFEELLELLIIRIQLIW